MTIRVRTEAPSLRGVRGKDWKGRTTTVDVDARGVEAALREGIEGEVRFDAGSRAMYSTDASNYRMVPIGVVIPRTRADIIETVAVCRRFGAPVLSRGGGTSIPGQCCNVAVVMDMSKFYNGLLWLDPKSGRARVQPGIVLDTLRDAAEEHNLTFGPDPATHTRCTLGGMMGNNSCGVHSVMAGRTVDNVESMEILTYDGEGMEVGPTPDEEIDRVIAEGGRRGDIYRRLRDLRDRTADRVRERYPRIPRRVSGYNLDELLPENGFNVARALVGTESTCVTILEATVRLVHSPPCRTLVVLGYQDIATAADHVPEVLEHGPVGLEGLDAEFIRDLKQKHLHPEGVELMPEGRGFLLVEFGGHDREEADQKARKLADDFRDRPDTTAVKVFTDRAQEKMVWEVRESGLGATAFIPGKPDNWEGWEDSAVPPDKVGAYIRDLRKLMAEFGYETSLYGHFGDGCLHARFNWDLLTAEGIASWRSFLEKAADLVIGYGGSLSGEHGDGQARGWLLPRMFGADLVREFREFKRIWDPDWKMNPGKVVDPYDVTENLRLGTDYRPPEPRTHFAFAADNHSFARAALRCVGAAVCRRKSGGTMCPSYMVTHEEMHSTRGRSRLLFEMLRGDPLKGGWKNEHVKEALDLCLACKGCKSDCPVQVDMATYKAEFLSHYYEGRLRPAHAYAFAMIPVWARLASVAPTLVNAITRAPLLAGVARAAAGMSPHREIPAFAPQTFQHWFARRTAPSTAGSRVILWADTFNNHFHTPTAKAAVEVLEAAGFRVQVPRQHLCCGRPLYDYGMLTMAKRWLRTIMDTLREDIRAGTPIVVLEPSCAAVFRDELTNFYPRDEDALRLKSNVLLLSEFLRRQAPGFSPPKLRRAAVLHGHCHQKSLMKMTDEEAILGDMGLDLRQPEPSCCGMAGAFGFERGDHYDVSIQCGERLLLPAVRSAEPDTLVIADGFSCREQIRQTTDRQALHLAQVIQMALREGESGPAESYPEGAYMRVESPEEARARRMRAAAVGVGAAALLGALAWRASRGRHASR